MTQEKFERFGNYILLEKLAAGGMAEIYLSKKLAAEGLQKFVAVKRILSQHSASEDFIRMFKDEAKIAVNLSHSNVVGIYDFGVENKQLYLVMDYVEGKNLRQMLNRLKQLNKRFSISHIVYTSKMIAAGLDHAHRLIDATTGQPLNIIHRDMSPQNVMISFEGEVKIIDFGIAKSTTQEENTRVGTLKGKFGYMSPEQVDGMEVDARTDIFAMGIMLWEMLSEQRLFLTNNEMSTLRKIRDCKIPSLRQMDPNIPIELEKIVNKALTRNKAQRYQTAAELQKDLQSFLNRYNPDFSSQDFSEFIKEIYAEEIVDARKRQVAYSKVDLPQIVEPERHSKQEAVTQSITYSKGAADKMNFGNLDLKKNASPAANLGDISQSHLSVKNSQPPITSNNYSSLGTSNRPVQDIKNYSQSAIRIEQYEERSSSFFGFIIIFLSLVVGGFAGLNQFKPQMVAEQCHQLVSLGLPLNCYNTKTEGTSAVASKDPVIKILSEPIGAHIYVDSQPTQQVTPAEVAVKTNKPFTISLVLPGHKSEIRQFNTLPASGFASFKLVNIPSGSIIVRIVGGEAYMGSQKLKNGEKLTVPANKLTKFKVINPLTGATKNINVTLEVNETREVILSPR